MRTRMTKRLMAFSLAGVMLLSLLASVTLLSDAYSTDGHATTAIATYGEDEGYDYYYRLRYSPYGRYDYYEYGYGYSKSEDDDYGSRYGYYRPEHGDYESGYDYYRPGYDDYGTGYDYDSPGYYSYELGYYPNRPEYESYVYEYDSYSGAYQREYAGYYHEAAYDRYGYEYDVKGEYTSEVEAEYMDLVYEKLGIKPFITMPPYSAVQFHDYTSRGVMVGQFHTPTLGIIPYMSIYIGGIRPEHWELHNWAIIYSIAEIGVEGNRVYEFWYDTFPADYVLVHRLPDSVCLEYGWWHMLPTFRVYLIPIPPVLSGTVTCEDTGRPIPDVRINLYDGAGALISYRITDGNGFFDFGEVPIGDLEVVMDYRTIPPGYGTDMTQVRRQLTTSPGGVYEEHYLVSPIRPPSLTKTLSHVNGEAHDGEAVYVGDVLTYVLTVNNPNRFTIRDFLVRDILPAGLSLNVDSVVVSPATALVYNASAANTVEVVLNLPVGDTTITFTALVTEEASEIIINTAILYGPAEDGTREEVDRDNEQIPVAEVYDPTLVKTATHVNGVAYTGDPVDVGDRVTYVLTVTNPNRRTLHNFLVRDELPDGLAWQLNSVIVNPKSALVYDHSAYNTVEVVLNLPPGDTTIAFTAEVTEEAYEVIINVATLYGPPEDGVREEVDDDIERVPVLEVNNPTITKTATYVNGEAYDGEVVDVGDIITYVLTVNNPNRRILRDFLVRDVLPGSLVLDVDSISVNPEGALLYNLSAYNTVEVILNLSSGNTTITFTTVVTEEAYEEIINVARIYSPPGDDGNREEVDDDDERVPVEEVVDPTLVKSAIYLNGEIYEGELADVGDVITYVLTVNNPNRRALNNFLVRDILPGSLALEVDSVVVNPENALVYNLSAYNTVEVILNLSSGTTTITFTAIVTEEAYEQIINVARIYGPPGDDGNREEVDDDTERVPVEEVINPTIVKSATYLNDEAYDGELVDVGDVITYVLTVNNPNRRFLNNFLVRDALPVGLALQVDSIVVYPENALVYNHSADNVVEVILNLPSGITTITFKAVVTAYAYEEIINVATIYSPPGDDGNREEVDDDTERVPVEEVIDPTIKKAITYVNDETHTGEAVDVGDVITYVLTVNNPNRRALNDFLVRDALPNGLALQVNSVVVYPADALAYNRSVGNTVEVILNLSAGDTTITFSAVVTEKAYEIIENVATIYSPPDEDGNREEVDDDTEEIPVVESEPPTITKAITHVNNTVHAGAAVVVGDAVTYVLTVNNPNRRTLNNFLVRDILPDGLALQLGSIVVRPAGALINNSSAANTIAVVLNLPSGDITITFTAVVTAVAYEEIINVAIIYGSPEDDGTREEVDQDDEVVEVALLPPTLTKTASYVGERVRVGDVITYALTVNNPNATVLENFVVIDALPVGLALNAASVNVNPATALVVNTTEGNTVRAVLNLPAGDTVITFTAVVTNAAGERIRNVARLYSPDGPVDEDDYTVNLIPGGGGDEEPPAAPPTPPTPPRPPAGPQTGDNGNLILWILLTSFGFVAFTGIAVRKQKMKVYNKRVDSLITEMVHYIQDK